MPYFPPSSTVSFGNPTALVGLTAVNGSATTAMRSDAAPALDQTAAYAFSGLGATTISQQGGSASALTLTGSTITTSQPLINATQTWNNAATVFTGIKLAVTNTASSTSSLLMDLGPVTVGLDGTVNGANLNSSGTTGLTLSQLAATIRLRNAQVIISAPAFATLQLGAANAASPVAQILQAQGSRPGTDNNVGGANLTITSGDGTGTGTVSTLTLQSPVAVASGIGAQTQTTGWRINIGTGVSTGYTVATLPATPLTGARAHVTDALAPTFLATIVGGGAITTPVFYNGSSWVGG